METKLANIQPDNTFSTSLEDRAKALIKPQYGGNWYFYQV